MINVALSAKLCPLFLEEIYQRDKILTAPIPSTFRCFSDCYHSEE